MELEVAQKFTKISQLLFPASPRWSSSVAFRSRRGWSWCRIRCWRHGRQSQRNRRIRTRTRTRTRTILPGPPSFLLYRLTRRNSWRNIHANAMRIIGSWRLCWECWSHRADPDIRLRLLKGSVWHGSETRWCMQPSNLWSRRRPTMASPMDVVWSLRTRQCHGFSPIHAFTKRLVTQRLSLETRSSIMQISEPREKGGKIPPLTPNLQDTRTQWAPIKGFLQGFCLKFRKTFKTQ